MSFIDRFKRITYSGRYLPEIDGLRFISIFMVVCMWHTGEWFVQYALDEKTAGFFIFRNFRFYGIFGVPLFFILSGFIVGLPFIEQKLLKKEPVKLHTYFIRRLTRIEPLYVVTLVGYFIMRVWVLQYQPFSEVLPHFIASLFYSHNLVYNEFSLINGVTWSLEVEVQFYILAPLITNIFLIKSKAVRRAILISAILLGYLLSFKLSMRFGVLAYLYCFLIGLFFAELFLCRKEQPQAVKKKNGLLLATLFILTLFINIDEKQYALRHEQLVLLFLILLFYFVLTKRVNTKILTNKYIVVIGGMCYSIYLTHMGIWGLIKHAVPVHPVSGSIVLNGLFYYVLTIFLILVASSILFLLVEKPTMKKDWYKRVFKRA